VRQILFEMKVVKKVIHPKVIALCKEIETWLRKKKAKSKDNEHKVTMKIQTGIYREYTKLS